MRGLALRLPRPRRARPWFALDVGSSAVKIAEVADGGDVVRAGSLPVPPGAVENGFVRRPDAVGDAVREFAGPARGRPRRAVVSVPGRGVIMKRLRISPRPLEKLDQAVEFEAMDAVPEDLDAVNLDYHVLGASEGGGLEVLLIAARKTLVESYVALLDAAGLVPAAVDVDYFALRVCVGAPEGPPPGALIHVGARSTVLHVPAGDPPGLTNELPWGGEQATESVAERLRVPRDEAEALKRGAPPPEVTGLLESWCDRFAADAGRGLGLLGGLGDGTGPRRVVLSGGGALLPGLGPSLARALDAEVRVYRPPFAGEGPSAPVARRQGPAFAVTAGLAARGPSE